MRDDPATSATSDGPRTWRDLLHADELPRDGTGRVLEFDGFRLAVFWVDGAPHVIDDECPHEGASLGDGVLIDCEVTCPWHGWHFDLCSGENTDGLGVSVRVHPSRVSPEGRVEAQLSAESA